jgi:hypothetical protein
VTGLVHDTKKSILEISGLITRRDSYVARANVRAERMRSEIEAAALRIESNYSSDAFRERALFVDSEVLFVDLRTAQISL